MASHPHPPRIAALSITEGAWSRSFGKRVRVTKSGTGALALEYGELVSEHEDLGVLGGRGHPMDPKQFGDTADQAVEEAGRHSWRASLFR